MGAVRKEIDRLRKHHDVSVMSWKREAEFLKIDEEVHVEETKPEEPEKGELY